MTIAQDLAIIHAAADSIAAKSGAIGSLPAVIMSPTANRVYQKSSSNEAEIRVTWRGIAQSVQLKQGNVVCYASSSGLFTGVSPGWYEAVLITDGVEGDRINVGVGDVYLVAGQSNGVSPLQPSTHVVPRPSAAGKVIISDYYSMGRDAFVDAFNCPMVSPFGGCCWIACGIRLARAWPVMFVIQSQGNTTTTQWTDAPLISRIFKAAQEYSPKRGIWLIGETNSLLGMSQTQSQSDMLSMFSSNRQISMMPWVIPVNSKNGFYNPMRAAHVGVVSQLNALWPGIALQGPDVDTIRNPATDPEQEFIGPKMEELGNLVADHAIANGW